MKIIERHDVSYNVTLNPTRACEDDCNNCWEKCNINDGDCEPDCNNCSDYACRDYL